MFSFNFCLFLLKNFVFSKAFYEKYILENIFRKLCDRLFPVLAAYNQLRLDAIHNLLSRFDFLQPENEGKFSLKSLKKTLD